MSSILEINNLSPNRRPNKFSSSSSLTNYPHISSGNTSIQLYRGDTKQENHGCLESIEEVISARKNRKSVTYREDMSENIRKFRKDVYGSIIMKGGKKHKVSFMDLPIVKINEQPSTQENTNEKGKEGKKKKNDLVQVVNIENYKKYNAKMSYQEYKYGIVPDDVVCCEGGCFIF